jgi:hypothetical protein
LGGLLLRRLWVSWLLLLLVSGVWNISTQEIIKSSVGVIESCS